MKLGLTGGIASGKSTVSAMLADQGALLIDADEVAREVVLPGSPTLAAIAERFGNDILLPDGSLDRKRLGNIVFRDEQERRALEAITHPAIRARMNELASEYERSQPDKLIIVDIPLLYESKMQSLFDGIIVVYVPRELQLDRLMKRDGLSEEQAMQRLDAQMNIEDKRQMADYVIHNEGDLDRTKRQVLELIKQIEYEKGSL